MDARATFGGSRISIGAVMTFAVAVLAAFLLGGAGGYLVRGWSSSPATTPTNTTTHPFVVETAPYGTPSMQPRPQQTTAPDGSTITF